jgi:hypothetical protein
MMLDSVSKELRKLSLQEKFIDLGGAHLLGRWLEPLPDNTYPNVAIVQEILQTISIMNIDTETLNGKSANLGKIVRAYAQGEAGH